MNKRMRTNYPPEFKAQAVQRAKAGDRSVRALEIELGLSNNLLRQWVQQFDRQGEAAFVRKAGASERESQAAGAGAGSAVSDPACAEQEVRRLRQRVAQLEQESTILKKALTLLGQEAWRA